MNIQHSPDLLKYLSHVAANKKKPEEVAFEFEKIFARQLVQQMTKGLFENDDNNTMMSGSGLYRKHIVDTLSEELAKQNKLGMGDLVLRYIELRNEQQ
ncbi:MAG TPA: hypothetical protein VK106_06045 [Balneolaceae bacterium]|nr:hypothetical protein [Balneolaceae bacterium]